MFMQGLLGLDCNVVCVLYVLYVPYLCIPGLWGFQSLVGYRYVVYGVLSAYGGESLPIRLLCIFQF